MSTFTREFLSTSPLNIGGGFGCAASATVIHTVPSGKKDEVWLYAVNNSASTSYICTIGFPGNDIRTTISPSSGLVLVVPGLTLDSGNFITARSDGASPQYMVVYGFANRIT